MVTHRFTFALLSAFTVCGVAAGQRVELLDFYLPTCEPCRAMAPTVQRLAAAGVPVRKIDGSRDVAAAQRFGVTRYPTFVVVADGVETGRAEGMASYERLAQLVRAAAPSGPKRPAPPRFAPVNRTFAAAPSGAHAVTVGADHGPGLPPIPDSPSGSDAGLLASSVRITVEDPAGRAFGTGTIIDARDGAALVVTCAHLFRDANKQPIDTEGRLTLELFDVATAGPRVATKVAGHLVSYDFEADVALVSFWTDRPVRSAPVASAAAGPREGDAVQSVGCDLGALPTVRQSRVVSLNRYTGPANIETTGAPVQGRSGGGLFDATGRLIGVCYAADEPLDEGLYAGLPEIHKQLDKVGLREVHQSSPPADVVAAATTPAATPSHAGVMTPAAALPAAAAAPLSTTPAATAPQAAAVAAQAPSQRQPSQLQPIEPAAGAAWPAPVVRGQSPAAAEPAPATMTASERATLAELGRRAATSEVVLMIRPNVADGPTEVVTIDAASPAFVEALRSLGPRTAIRQ